MLRLLPYVIVSLVLFLGSKLLDAFDYADAHANMAEPAKNLEEETSNAAGSEIFDLNNEISLAATDENEFLNVQRAVSDISSKSTEKKSLEKSENALKSPTSSEPSSKSTSSFAPYDVWTKFTDFSPITLDILQELKQRREELESREQEFLLRLNALNVAKQELESKIVILAKLQVGLEDSLKKYDALDKERNAKLVKIYESMKPSDAAKIFDDMQTLVLLDVVEQMKEARLAPILASMDPEKAKELTIGLINRKKVAVN